MDKKGQHEAITAVMISGILIGMVGSVYFWGLPLIQKSRSATVLENSESLMFVLDQKIKNVASVGGRENIRLTDAGFLRVADGKLLYEVNTDGTIYAVNSNIPLGKTLNCDNTKMGSFGKDESAIICIYSNQLSKSQYANTYSLSYRNMAAGLKVYNINIATADDIGSEGNTVIIQNNGVASTLTTDGKEMLTVNIGITIE
jgi:hypothetical protein